MKKNKMREKPVISTALLKIKYIQDEMNFESIPFEELINSSNTSIKIDFPDGRFYMEENFRSISSPMEKFYMEFFEEFDRSKMMEYLSSIHSDFRVTSMEGSVIRLSHEDYLSIPPNIMRDTSTKPLKEYIFVKEKRHFFQRDKKKLEKKED